MGEFREIRQVSDVYVEGVLAERMAEVLGENWAGLRLAGDAWAYVEAGRARGLGGIEPLWRGRYVLWSYEGGLRLGDWKRVLRFTRLRLERALADPAVRRIESTALVEPHYCRFLERLGFQPEGLMQRYSPAGDDMMMFSRVAL